MRFTLRLLLMDSIPFRSMDRSFPNPNPGLYPWGHKLKVCVLGIRSPLVLVYLMVFHVRSSGLPIHLSDPIVRTLMPCSPGNSRRSQGRSFQEYYQLHRLFIHDF
jgi:hypothetical protein